MCQEMNQDLKVLAQKLPAQKSFINSKGQSNKQKEVPEMLVAKFNEIEEFTMKNSLSAQYNTL